MQKLVQRTGALALIVAEYLTDQSTNAEQKFIGNVIGHVDCQEQLTAVMEACWTHEKEAIKTKSDSYFGEVIPEVDLRAALLSFIAAAERLDAIKKALFYGKPYQSQLIPIGNDVVFSNVAELPAFVHDTHVCKGVDIIHSIIGSATEAGEKAELLLCVMDGKPFDPVGFAEEMGDGRWYDAIGAVAIGKTLNDIDRGNVEKLIKKRYKTGAFTANEALERDTNAERSQLEKSFMKGVEST